MRNGISTVQQTLSPEAAAVLKRAVADAARRGHAQVTPLHVASSLLSSGPSSILQQACVQSHRHVPHPLQCRALELCFNVALERLPATTSSHTTANVPCVLSNALVAALKRAQAHQRRGCPEQQQMPLLAVKVEMEQLVISMLDDPSVSRVMREAGFSSTRAKTSLETSCVTSQSNHQEVFRLACQSSVGIPVSDPRSAGSINSREAETVISFLCRKRKQRNVVLIGDEPSTSSVTKEVIRNFYRHIELRQARILTVQSGFGTHRDETQKCMEEIEQAEKLSREQPVIVFLGNLSWCVEQQHGNMLVGELARIFSKAEEREQHPRFWYVACATSHVYMRFLAKYPAMESSLGFQPLPVSNASIRPRFSLHEQSLARLPKIPFKIPPLEEQNCEELSCCPECTAKFEQESFFLLHEQQHKTESVQSSSGDSLPFWMKDNKNTKTTLPQPQEYTQLLRDLRRKWNRNCLTVHSNTMKTSTLPNLIDSNSSSSQNSSPKKASSWLSLSTLTEDKSTELGFISGGAKKKEECSKITTDLVLGTPNTLKTHHERLQDTSGCTHIEDEYSNADDVDLFKRIYQALTENIPWQTQAAAKVAKAIAECKRRWLLLTGPDSMGKRKVAKTLAQILYGGHDKVVKLNLVKPSLNHSRSLWGEEVSPQQSLWGKTILDRIADAVKQKPFSVVLLEDFGEADVSVKKTLWRYMERGKIQHSSGREVSLNNVMILLTSTKQKLSIEEKLGSVEATTARVSLEKGGGVSEVRVVDNGEVLERFNVNSSKRLNWGEKLEGLIGSRKMVKLDLNLGLGNYQDEGLGFMEGFEGLTVEFEEFNIECVARTVMEKVQSFTKQYEVCVEIERRILEVLMAGIWEDGDGEGFEKWFRDNVECQIGNCDTRYYWVVRIVSGA